MLSQSFTFDSGTISFMSFSIGENFSKILGFDSSLLSLMSALIYEVKTQPSMACLRHSWLKNCSVGWNSQEIGQFCSMISPFGVLQRRFTQALKKFSWLFRLSLTRISPPIVQITSLWISSYDGKTVLTLEIVQEVCGALKCPLYAGTSSESGDPKTSISFRSQELIEISKSSAEGKNPKSKVSKTYLRISPSFTAQKQLNPFTFLSFSQTLERKPVEMPTTVKLTPSYVEACSIKFFQPSRLLSPTSVIIMILFSQLMHQFSCTNFFSNFLESQKPLLMVVPPLVLIASIQLQTSFERFFFNVGAKMVCPQSLKVVSPTESLGLSLEINILIASIDSCSLDRLLFISPPKLPSIEPEISRQMRALIGVSSRSAPSLLLFKNRARQSLTLLSKWLLVN